MAIYEIGETIVYTDLDGDEALGIIRSIVDPLNNSEVSLYEVQDVETGEYFTVAESRISGASDI
ncbi:hypothetical protein B0T20DRAFT_102745 [Sordaria brevicollis]|uniref:Uncharacterized protein n=1 Tax=Sordaria brevicollis TaxID=83679 RepID=A0AAE0NWB3_SORBR|nr:hypothetical protein B0T20DRAFT_102745 [Sordaria brevicollis]